MRCVLQPLPNSTTSMVLSVSVRRWLTFGGGGGGGGGVRTASACLACLSADKWKTASACLAYLQISLAAWEGAALSLLCNCLLLSFTISMRGISEDCHSWHMLCKKMERGVKTWVGGRERGPSRSAHLAAGNAA